jgi:response regulator RpfG family c-di-GMP phosphodiesterase
MTHRVLIVDDDTNLLEGYARHLNGRYDVRAAPGSAEALALMRDEGPVAVVLSDMYMPGMNGIAFLQEVRRHWPDTVRMMLTGQADIDMAIAAINEGNIFRFLTKPVTRDEFDNAFKAGVRQYQLVTAERDLLQETLHGSVKMLTDILALVNPVAFSGASRVKRYVALMASRLGLDDAWEFELAAMLAHIGCIALPPDVLAKAYVGGALSDEETALLTTHAATGKKLLENIPRLESVAEMIGRQHALKGDAMASMPLEERGRVVLGAQLLQVASALDAMICGGMSMTQAMAKLRASPKLYDPDLIRALAAAHEADPNDAIKTVPFGLLRAGMMIQHDIRTKGGLLLVSAQQEVTEPLRARLLSFAERGELSGSVAVTVSDNMEAEHRAKTRELSQTS